MPSVSQAQQRFMGREYGLKKAGKPTRTQMSLTQLREYATTPKGRRLPERLTFGFRGGAHDG